jgi:hypothetical protein
VFPLPWRAGNEASFNIKKVCFLEALLQMCLFVEEDIFNKFTGKGMPFLKLFLKI